MSEAVDFALREGVDLLACEDVFHECGGVEDRDRGVHEGDCISGDFSEACSTKQSQKLFLRKNRAEILRICEDKVPIFPFKVVVDASCERVRFLTEFPRAKAYYHIERGEVFGPSCLTA